MTIIWGLYYIESAIKCPPPMLPLMMAPRYRESPGSHLRCTSQHRLSPGACLRWHGFSSQALGAIEGFIWMNGLKIIIFFFILIWSGPGPGQGTMVRTRARIRTKARAGDISVGTEASESVYHLDQEG